MESCSLQEASTILAAAAFPEPKAVAEAELGHTLGGGDGVFNHVRCGESTVANDRTPGRSTSYRLLGT